jgi:hypothetical protein
MKIEHEEGSVVGRLAGRLTAEHQLRVLFLIVVVELNRRLNVRLTGPRASEVSLRVCCVAN